MAEFGGEAGFKGGGGSGQMHMRADAGEGSLYMKPGGRLGDEERRASGDFLKVANIPTVAFFIEMTPDSRGGFEGFKQAAEIVGDAGADKGELARFVREAVQEERRKA